MDRFRIHCLQHVPFEGPGYIETWAKEKGHLITSTKFYINDKFPRLDDIDLLVVLGGPMGVYDDAQYSWLKAEKDFVQQAIEASKFVLGICLGSQLIANVLGAKVYQNNQKEIGWFPITLSEGAQRYKPFSHVPQTMNVLHWHGDTFDLPAGAVLLASSDACRHQAFAYSNHVLALQFHFEMTKSGLLQIIQTCEEDLVTNGTIQSANEMFRKENFHQSRATLYEMLDNFLSLKEK